MEVFEAVRTLPAVREYQDKPVPSETLRRIVEAGRPDRKQHEPTTVALYRRRTPRHVAAVRRIGDDRAIYSAGAAGDCRGDSKDTVLGFGWKPRDPIDDVDSLVRRSRLKLGWLYGTNGSQTAPGHPGRFGRVGDHPVWLSGSAGRQRTEKSQATLRDRPPRAVRTAVSMTRLMKKD
jgi:nitroreductase